MKDDRFTSDDRHKAACVLAKLFDWWHLDDSEAMTLFENQGIEWSGRERFSLPDNQEVLNRAGELLAIHKKLKILFSMNPELSRVWIKTPNKAFAGVAPLEIILREGAPGISKIRAYIESSRGL